MKNIGSSAGEIGLGKKLKVAIVSDVSVGYGTPQILRTANSFASHFDALVTILEPDQPERPSIDVRNYCQSGVLIKRLYTTQHPYTSVSRVEFVELAARELLDDKPDIVIVSSSYGMPVVEKADLSDALCIFYCLEHIDQAGSISYIIKNTKKYFSVYIFPEENRAEMYSDRLGVQETDDLLIMYNANNIGEYKAAVERNGRFFLGGSFHKDMTFASYYLEDSINTLPIDIYGIIDGFEHRSNVLDIIKSEQSRLRYKGYHPADERFFSQLSEYQYSLVMWNPSSEPTRFAAPNKMFDAIAYGVPPICAPHPQCVDLIEKYSCGLLLDDWSIEALKSRLTQAAQTFGTDFYSELVRNCKVAMNEELSWDNQFDKLASIVRKKISTSVKG